MISQRNIDPCSRSPAVVLLSIKHQKLNQFCSPICVQFYPHKNSHQGFIIYHQQSQQYLSQQRRFILTHSGFRGSFSLTNHISKTSSPWRRRTETWRIVCSCLYSPHTSGDSYSPIHPSHCDLLHIRRRVKVHACIIRAPRPTLQGPHYGTVSEVNVVSTLLTPPTPSTPASYRLPQSGCRLQTCKK